MTNLVPAKTPMAQGLTFDSSSAFGSDIQDLLELQRSSLINLSTPNANFDEMKRLIVGQSDSTKLHRVISAQTFQEALFNSLVELKVGVAQFAMHLSSEVRSKLFSDLDDVINIEDWYEGDTLPVFSSFRDFLKWTIYSKRFNWTSISVSDEGEILVAWKSINAVVTARYDGSGRVWWTATKGTEQEKNHAAGDSSLEFFEEDARRYLD